jgi:hypothetical protein
MLSEDYLMLRSARRANRYKHRMAVVGRAAVNPFSSQIGRAILSLSCRLPRWYQRNSGNNASETSIAIARTPASSTRSSQ